MRHLFAGFVILFLLLPTVQAFGQTTNTVPTLAVKLTSTQPFIYKNADGYTVVIGEVENTRNFPVNNVKIGVGFYGTAAAGPGGVPPLETATGTSLLEVIPPNSKSPFIVLSNTPNPGIAEVGMNILGFNSAPQKPQLLEITSSSAVIGDAVNVSAQVTNKGQQDAETVSVHLVAYDSFRPPRIVGIETAMIEIIPAGGTENIAFDAIVDRRASSFKIIAESHNYQSRLADISDVTLESLTQLVTIQDVQIINAGETVTEINIGTPVDITSQLSIQIGAQTSPQQDFVYYAQVRQFGERPQVEFLGFFEGTFTNATSQSVSVQWVPESEGVFFIETYVWDVSGIALAPPGKTISIILVTT